LYNAIHVLDPLEAFLAPQPQIEEEMKKNQYFDIDSVAHNTRERKMMVKEYYHGESSQEKRIRHP
jgi:hypothetical protein